MEQQALEEKLDRAKTSLLIGPIRETLVRFLATAATARAGGASVKLLALPKLLEDLLHAMGPGLRSLCRLQSPGNGIQVRLAE